MDISEVMETPAFWILGGGGIAAELGGWVLGRNMGWTPMPFWQLGVMMVGTLVAAAFFAMKE